MEEQIKTKKMTFKFEVYTFLVWLLLGLSFVMMFIHNIVTKAGFEAYEFWLLRYAFLVVLYVVFLSAREKKGREPLLFATTMIVAHFLIYSPGSVSFDGFYDFVLQARFLTGLVLIGLVLLVVASYINKDLFAKLEVAYKWVVAILFGVIGFIFLLDTLINGFKYYGDIQFTRAFFGLGGVFYYAATTLLFFLPIIDSGALAKKKEAKAEGEEAEPATEPEAEKAETTEEEVKE